MQDQHPNGLTPEQRADQPFHGNGTRYQNMWGSRPKWWQISYDTSTQGGRLAQGLSKLFALIILVSVAALLIRHM